VGTSPQLESRQNAYTYKQIQQNLDMPNKPRNPATNEPNHSDDYGDGAALLAERPKLKKPPRYNVMLMNDDYTPMEFVVDVLRIFFRHDRPKATQIMLEVHTKGKAVCGTYTRDIAETKTAQVNDYSREHQHPLLCVVEPA
jgi:ATP-dependent Clp protease adaptor protein ClpS